MIILYASGYTDINNTPPLDGNMPFGKSLYMRRNLGYTLVMVGSNVEAVLSADSEYITSFVIPNLDQESIIVNRIPEGNLNAYLWFQRYNNDHPAWFGAFVKEGL